MDIFDRAEEKKDLFDRLKFEDIFDRIKIDDIFDKVKFSPEEKIINSQELKDLIKKELAKEIGNLHIEKILSEILKTALAQQKEFIEKTSEYLKTQINEAKSDVKKSTLQIQADFEKGLKDLKNKYDDLKTSRLNQPYLLGGFSLPVQTGNSGKYLTTDGISPSWGTVDLTGYVPYLGATTDVNLGSKNFLTTGTLGAGAITGNSFIIGANTLDTNEWAFLDGQDQAVKTTSSPTFVNVSLGGYLTAADTSGLNTYFQVARADGGGYYFGFKASKGTIATPLDIGTAADIGGFISYGYSGGAFRQMGQFKIQVDGTYTSGQAPPSCITFHTNKAGNASGERMRIDQAGRIGILTATPNAWIDIKGTTYAGSAVDLINLRNSTGTLLTSIDTLGHIMIGATTAPTAYLHLGAGTATAGYAPLKFTAGVLNSVAEAGTVEYTTGLFQIRSDSLNLAGSKSYQIDTLRMLSYKGTSPNENIFWGQSGNFTMTGTGNVFGGNDVGTVVTTGYENVALGQSAASSLTEGAGNFALGYLSQYWNQTGSSNVSIGSTALKGTTGHTAVYYNVAIGAVALGTTWGTGNVGIGYNAGKIVTSGAFNSLIGYGVAQSLTTQNYNTVVGSFAGGASTTNSSVFLGTYAGYYETADNKLFIDNQDRTSEAISRTNALIYGVFNATPANQTLTFNALVQTLKLGAGNATAGYAPLKFTSGVSLTTAEAGAMEFTTNDLYFTITTGAARKGIILNDGANLTSGKVPVATTNGRLIDSSGVSGSFTTVDSKTVTVTNGLITAIV